MKPLQRVTYDRLKFFTQIILPAIGTLYFALAGIWGLPAADAIVATVVAVDTFLGVVLQISTSAYNNSDEKYDGAINVLGRKGDDLGNFSISLPVDANHVENSKEILLKVKHPKKKPIAE